MVDARKKTLGRDDALALLQQADELYVSKGTKLDHFDLRATKDPKSEIVEMMLGPTGNLRAPALKVGRTLLIGFSEETYKTVFAAKTTVTR